MNKTIELAVLLISTVLLIGCSSPLQERNNSYTVCQHIISEDSAKRIVNEYSRIDYLSNDNIENLYKRLMSVSTCGIIDVKDSNWINNFYTGASKKVSYFVKKSSEIADLFILTPLDNNNCYWFLITPLDKDYISAWEEVDINRVYHQSVSGIDYDYTIYFDTEEYTVFNVSDVINKSINVVNVVDTSHKDNVITVSVDPTVPLIDGKLSGYPNDVYLRWKPINNSIDNKIDITYLINTHYYLCRIRVVGIKRV